MNQPCILTCWKFSVPSGPYPSLSTVYKSVCCASFRSGPFYYWSEYSYFNGLCHSSGRNGKGFPLSISQDAASDAWRLLSWTIRQRWDTAIQNTWLPIVSLLLFHMKRPCWLVLSSAYCSGNLTIICPWIANMFSEYNQQDATFLNLFISVRRSTCFRQFSAHHLELKTAHTVSGICQAVTATCC